MSTILNPAEPCPNCGRPQPAGALSGLCPACLLAQGAETENEAVGGTGRFEPPSLETVAQLFPQLEILGLLGVGGMGAVYKARQPRLDRLVALKILPAGGGSDFAERFNREARALARLSHPNIVNVHEFGQVEGRHFFLMEFVDGANLRQLERAGRLSPREALQIIPQICDALQYAHDEGVVHRDIKPENVLVDRKGRVKIADFGLAKILGTAGESLRLTREGQVMGTPHYMAPEQVERPLTVDHRADIYSLGVVFYEMLTGDLPLGKFSPPSRKYDLDVRLDDVVLRALENDPVRRYQRASEVKTRVEAITSTPSGPAAPVTEEPPKHYLFWAGHPLVQERDGNRTIHRRGIGRAWGFSLLFLTLGCGLVWNFTDSQFPGWASLFVRILVAVIVIGWGVMRAKRSSRTAEPLPRSRRGKEKFPHLRPGFVFSQLALGGLIAVVLGSLTNGRWVAPEWPPGLVGNPHPANPLQVAARDPNTGTLGVTLPDGGTMELLALTEVNTPSRVQWRPDGTPLTNLNFQVRRLADFNAPGARKLDLAFKVSTQPPKIGSAVFEFEPNTIPMMGGELWANGDPWPSPGGWAMRVAYGPDASTATLRFGWCPQPWRNVLVYRPDRDTTTTSRRRGDPEWPDHLTVSNRAAGLELAVVLGPDAYNANDGRGDSEAIVPSPAERNWRLRVVAVDFDGRVHHNTGLRNEVPDSDAGQRTTWVLGFPSIRRERVREILLQVQPVNWVEFPDIALRPNNGLTTSAPEPHFTTVTERTFDELLDLDTGKTGEFPKDGRNGNPLAGIGENLNWMQLQGFDLGASTDELEALGVNLVDLPNTDWETLPPTGLLQRLSEGGAFRFSLTPNAGKLPATFGFRTREGGTGILQWLAIADSGAGATVRYKLIDSSHAR